MKFIRDNFWQMLIAGAILLWAGWVSLGVHHSVSEERLTKTTDQFAQLVKLMLITTREMVTKKDLYEVREDMRTIREDMRAGFERIDRRLEALEKRLDKRIGSSGAD